MKTFNLKRIAIAWIGICLTTFSHGQSPTPVPQAATLQVPVQVPIVINGKIVGNATIPQGTPTKVLQEYGNKVLIVTGTISTPVWVDKTQIQMQPKQEIATTASATPTPTTATTPAPKQNPKTSARKARFAPRTAPDKGHATKHPELPADFKWDRTAIIPGQWGYLNITGINQKRNGTCGGVAILIITSYSDPTIKLSEEEVFKLIKNGGNATSVPEAFQALKNLGFTAEIARTSETPTNVLLEKIQESIEAKYPVYVCTTAQARGIGAIHAMVVCGFDKTNKSIFFHKGGRNTTEKEIPHGYKYFIFVKKNYETASAKEQQQIEAILKTSDLRKHTLNLAHDQESPQEYASHAIPQCLKVALRGGRMAIIPKGKEMQVIMPQNVPEDDLTRVVVKTCKLEAQEANGFWKNSNKSSFSTEEKNKPKTMALSQLASNISNNNGVFFSALPPPQQ